MARVYQGDAVCECGKDVPVYKTDGGMLTTSCGWCRKQEHCGAGSASYRKMTARIKAGINPDDDGTKAQVVAKPAEKTIFDIF